MRYMLLIFGPEDDFPAQGTPEFAAAMHEYFEFTRDLRAAGVMDRGDELNGSVTATTVRVRDGNATLTDGPFIETKEQLGGYYIIDVPNLDEAIRWAARIPGARNGAVEVRPIIEHD
jgi:hypothetical protein